METWQRLELEYAARLRTSLRAERKRLYAEAYSEVSRLRAASLPQDPEKRTAGTSAALVRVLRRVMRPSDRVLEVGCGRGYTCLKLAPHVHSIVGVDVSGPALQEAEALLRDRAVTNARVLSAAGDELAGAFGSEAFDTVIWIDVFEHLHPEDALEAVHQIHAVLRPGGVAITVTPNRLFGPHDITRELFPAATEPLGFHLNETTYTDLVHVLRRTGFDRFRTLRTLSWASERIAPPRFVGMTYPTAVSLWLERHWRAPQAGHGRPQLVGERVEHALRNIRLLARKRP